jgi:hypothetical protein
MLIFQCAQGYIGWVFEWVAPGQKQAHCLHDDFKIAYNPGISIEWQGLVQQMAAHSVGLKGAFVTTHWLEP